MIINQTNLTQLLTSFNLGYLVDYSSWYGDGPMELGVMIVSSTQVLLNMMVILVLALYAKNIKDKNNSFYFIVNLAATDIVGFLLLLVAFKIQESALDYKDSGPDIFLMKMTEGCQIQMGLLSFSYLHTIFATVSLTFERFLFISYPFKYKIIITKESCLK